MIIGYLDLVSIRTAPAKTYAPLPVYPDAVLSGAVTFEFLQLIAKRYPEIFQPFGRIQYQQFPERDPPDIG